MDKRPNIKKRIALELFRSIKKNRAKLHELRTLFWECTLRCNVSCRHCGSDCHVSASVPDMPVEDFLKVIDDITPYVEPNKVLVIFTGGEALVRKDIEKCGLELYRRGYPWGIVSNGYLMTRERKIKCLFRNILKDRLQWLSDDPGTARLALGFRIALGDYQPRWFRGSA